jgi:hypothetical protein
MLHALCHLATSCFDGGQNLRPGGVDALTAHPRVAATFFCRHAGLLALIDLRHQALPLRRGLLPRARLLQACHGLCRLHALKCDEVRTSAVQSVSCCDRPETDCTLTSRLLILSGSHGTAQHFAPFARRARCVRVGVRALSRGIQPAVTP